MIICQHCAGNIRLPAQPLILSARILHKSTNPKKKRVLASSRVQLIAKEIEWLRLDPQMHDQMFYDALSTCEQMLKHIAASVKNSERDFYMDTVESEKEKT